MARFSTGLWGCAAIAVLLWPDHLSGRLDGAPLDRVAEAVLAGLVAPVLWWLHPAYLRHRLVRVLIVALIVGKIGASLLAHGGKAGTRAVVNASPDGLEVG